MRRLTRAALGREGVTVESLLANRDVCEALLATPTMNAITRKLDQLLERVEAVA